MIALFSLEPVDLCACIDTRCQSSAAPRLRRRVIGIAGLLSSSDKGIVRGPAFASVYGYALRVAHDSPIGDGQSGYLPPRDMTLVCLGAVDTVPLEHVVFGASIAIPLPETLQKVHRCMLPRGVLTHNALSVAEIIHPTR